MAIIFFKWLQDIDSTVQCFVFTDESDEEFDHAAPVPGRARRTKAAQFKVNINILLNSFEIWNESICIDCKIIW